MTWRFRLGIRVARNFPIAVENFAIACRAATSRLLGVLPKPPLSNGSISRWKYASVHRQFERYLLPPLDFSDPCEAERSMRAVAEALAWQRPGGRWSAVPPGPILPAWWRSIRAARPGYHAANDRRALATVESPEFRVPRCVCIPQLIGVAYALSRQ